jgi:threonine synthase
VYLHEGRPVLVRYDLERVRNAVDRNTVSIRGADMWRYRELLPIEDDADIVTLGEGWTPLLTCPRLGHFVGLSRLLIKDEGRMPTASFKVRGMSVAISMAKARGVRRVAVPTAGNAGGAAAAYAARAGLEAFVFMPADSPRINQFEAVLHGGKVFLVDGLIDDCGRIVREGQERMGWLDLSTLREPYRLEGKKTMGFELAEQLGWTLPDVIVYPTGGGTGLIGMWKAFGEWIGLGWIAPERLPRMVAVQSDGCCPIVRAFQSGARFAERYTNCRTIAQGLRVPSSLGDFLVLDAVRSSDGTAIAVREDSIVDWSRRASSEEGISVGPEGATCLAAVHELAKTGWIGRDERVVVFNCSAAQKTPDIVSLQLPTLDVGAVDWSEVASF